MTNFTVESWIWYGVVAFMVVLRYTARILLFKSPLRLQVEDWLMLFIFALYTILIAFLNVDATVNTNLINPADIPHLTPQDIRQRTWGSKTVLLVEQCMCAVQWGTKICLLILYWRLTQNPGAKPGCQDRFRLCCSDLRRDGDTVFCSLVSTVS